MINEFLNSLKEFENLEGFLEHISLVMENIATTDQTITLMTMHAAKGLEFDYVFLAGWEEGIFPSKRSLEELGTKGLEEERRQEEERMRQAEEERREQERREEAERIAEALETERRETARICEEAWAENDMDRVREFNCGKPQFATPIPTPIPTRHSVGRR